MLSRFFPLLFLPLAACLVPAESTKSGSVSGNLVLTAGSRGDAFVLLLPQSAESSFSVPLPAATAAVSDLRLAAGDTRFHFARVDPNPYRAIAVLDVNRNLDLRVDVLAQPGAGDRLTTVPVDFNLQPGEARELDLVVDLPVSRDPPAFLLEGFSGDAPIALPDQPALVPLTIVAADLPELPGAKSGWEVSLVDEDGDGRADDVDGDGVVDLSPRILLRFVPGPGQTPPVDSAGQPAIVVVPLAFDPSPFLALFGGDLSRKIVVDRLQTLLIPRAMSVSVQPGRGAVTESLDAIPVGDYELWMVEPGNQFWKLPNALGARHADQAVRFRFIHGNSFDGGSPP